MRAASDEYVLTLGRSRDGQTTRKVQGEGHLVPVVTCKSTLASG